MEEELFQEMIDIISNPNPETGLVSLNELYRIGNKLRASQGKNVRFVKDFLGSPEVQEFITALSENLNVPREQLYTVTQGKFGGTQINPILAMQAISRIDPLLDVMAYELLLTNWLKSIRQ